MNKIIVVSQNNKFAEIKTILHHMAPAVKVQKLDGDFSAQGGSASGWDNVDIIIAGEDQAVKINSAAKNFPGEIILVLNYDKPEIWQSFGVANIKKIGCGFLEGADFLASDLIETDEGASFKLNHSGSSVPIWIKGKFGKEKIYSALSIICVGTLLGMNIIEVSEKLKNL